MAVMVRGIPGNSGGKISISDWLTDSALDMIWYGIFSFVRRSLFPNVSAICKQGKM